MGYESLDNGDSGLAAQLCSLYAERDQLHREIGVSDATEIINMVKSLEAQLVSLYGSQVAGSGGGSANPVEEILALRSQLGDLGTPEVVFESSEGRRTLRAIWKNAA